MNTNFNSNKATGTSFWKLKFGCILVVPPNSAFFLSELKVSRASCNFIYSQVVQLSPGRGTTMCDMSLYVFEEMPNMKFLWCQDGLGFFIPAAQVRQIILLPQNFFNLMLFCILGYFPVIIIPLLATCFRFRCHPSVCISKAKHLLRWWFHFHLPAWRTLGRKEGGWLLHAFGETILCSNCL